MYTFTIEDDPKSEDVAALGQGLRAHSLLHTQQPGFLPIAVFMRDAEGKLVGGMWGYINWNWLYVGLVWLSEDLRGGGHGKRLLLALEGAGRRRAARR